jgi:dihydropteroate synthase
MDLNFTRTLIMGVLNVTPDSFSDGGLFESLESAIHHASLMEEEGADIIDLGGQSTRPIPIYGDTSTLSIEEEQRRITPVLQALVGSIKVPISVDTYHASTADMALKAGAHLINDVGGLLRDPNMASVVAHYGAPVVIMHSRESFDPEIDILEDMERFFHKALARASTTGIQDRQIILDPGIGFGKTPDQNNLVLRHLFKLKAFGFPLLVGASRKYFLSTCHPPNTPPSERLFSTLGVHITAVTLGGANILRVHDVKAHKTALCAADRILCHG